MTTIEWTETARRILDDYCTRSKTVLEGTGADTTEVIDDLRRHVDEEVRNAGIPVVTEDVVRRILARVGEPEAGAERKVATAPPVAPEKEEKKRPGFLLLIPGVILPLGAFIFELVTGICAGILFDPMPTWLQILAVASVPAINFWIWRAARSRDNRHAKLLGWLSGGAMGICLYYAILYVPFTPIAALGVIYFGLGLIPLSPYLALAATGLLRKTYRKQIGAVSLPGFGKGVFISFGLLVLLQLPTAITYYGLATVCSDEATTRDHGIRVLRTFGDRELMLRAAYGLLRREMNMDVVRLLSGGDRNISAEQAREAYYRVTGKPFNAVPPPSLYTRTGRWTAMDEDFAWDDAVGGEAVAGRVKGLSLSSSRMDAIAGPDAALVYCEWTLEFKNVSATEREARAQIALPPGAVVSRVTLWVNGEEREAAFGGRAQTRKAYQEVAVVQRRDPILVTTCGPDRVLVQCFPVPRDGGVMKVRIGVTAPLILESLDHGTFVWPRFLERNFAIAADFKHGLWIESASPLSGANAAPAPSRSSNRPFMFHKTLLEKDLSGAAESVKVNRSPDVKAVWTPSGKDHVIRQTIASQAPVATSRIVLVLDGSAGMKQSIRDISQALSDLPAAAEVAVIVASDEIKEPLSRLQKMTPATASELSRRLEKTRFVGGQDNLPALEAAWELAAAAENGSVIWIHEPQPVLLSSESGLLQQIERSASTTRLFELQVDNGPDRIVEKLDGFSAVEHVPCLHSPRTNLSSLFNQLAGKAQRLKQVREQIAASPENSVGPQVDKHIERLWARDESRRLTSSRQRDAAAKLAAENQIVTPVTGAVVLETQQQFTQNNLNPADPATVPSVPEPQPGMLIVVGILVFAASRHFKRRETAAAR